MASQDQSSAIVSTDPIASYPAPSAAATPTTITEGRQLAQGSQAPIPGSEMASVPVTYPDTSYPALPPAQSLSTAPAAPAIPSMPNNGLYAANSQPMHVQTTSLDAVSQNFNAGAAPVGTNHVQDGLYPTANSGTATTWDTPSLPQTPQGLAASTPQGSAPPNFGGDDFVATVANQSTLTSAPSSDTNHANYEMPVGARQGIAPAVHLASESHAPSSGGHGQPSTPGAQFTPQTATSGSHYANIAASQMAAPRTGPWRPGTTSDLPREATSTATANTQLSNQPSANSAANWEQGATRGWE